MSIISRPTRPSVVIKLNLVNIPLSITIAHTLNFIFNSPLSTWSTFYGIRMLLFLKFNNAYLNQKNSDQKKGFKSFLWTLFNIRFNSYIVPLKTRNSNEKENSLIIIASPTTSQINQKLFNRFIITFIK